MTQHIPLSQQQAHEPHTKSFIEDGIDRKGTETTLRVAAAGKPSLFDRNSRKATARTASPPCTDHPLEDCLGRTMEKKEKQVLSFGFGLRRFGVFFIETFHPSFGIHNFLGAREKRMATGTDVDL